MILLPAVNAEVGSRLPMADGSAARLAEALVGMASSGAIQSMAQVLAADPPLVLWCVCRADAQTRELRTLRQAAAWLLEQAVVALNWQGGALPGDASSRQQRLAALVEASIERVEIGRFANPSAMGPLDDAEGLVDLLDNAAAWLTATCSGETIDAQAAMPAWLLTQIAQRKPIVAECYERLAETDRRAARRHAAAARDRWLAPGPLAPTFLIQLVQRLRRLAALETRFDDLLESEKLEAMAEFAAGAGHEINNPLAVISGRAQLFLRDEADPERRRELALINSQAMRIYEMIADMMLFARPPQPELSRVEFGPLVETVLKEMKAKATERRIEFRAEPVSQAIHVKADATQLTVALRAVIDNALEAIGSDGWIAFCLVLAENGKAVRITVRDSGPGIPADVRRHLFDPYFSGRKAGRGLGLGLAKCWRIATNHGGTVTAESPPGGGAALTISLPVCS